MAMAMKATPTLWLVRILREVYGTGTGTGTVTETGRWEISLNAVSEDLPVDFLPKGHDDGLMFAALRCEVKDDY